MTPRLSGLVALGFLIVCFGASLAGQNTRGPATLDDLLSEIQGLRADLARSSGATVRTQMLVARMQIQEQRINTVLRQITEVQNQMVEARQMVAANESSFKRVENGIAGTTNSEHRETLTLELADMKQRLGPVLALFQQRVQELTLRQSELMNQFATEQIRWNDFNDRLDALERSLQSQ